MTDDAFVHLHVHSAFSLLEGAIHIGKLAGMCRTDGMPAVAVTDRNNLFGSLEASETLSGAGVQPIVGIELSVTPASFNLEQVRGRADPALVLLVQNAAGYANLMKLASAAYLAPPEAPGPCLSLEMIAAQAEGLICLTGGQGGPVDLLLADGRTGDAEAALDKLAAIFPGRLYVELQRIEAESEAAREEGLVDFAYAKGLPLVATNGVFFSKAEDYSAHDALICIADGAYVEQTERRKLSPEQYFKSGAEMRALFTDLPEAVDATMEIAQRCAFRPRTHPPILPSFTKQPGGEADELRAQAKAGLEKRLTEIEPAAELDAYWKRLDFELDIIVKMEFPGYFLIVADFIQWAKDRDIPVGPGRGSGAGSVVAWALTITDLDPLRFGLLFERFLNPERVSMPDFDVDFCQDRRDEVIQYVKERYGADRVAQIITFGKLQARAVLRDVGRVLGLPYGQVDRLCKLVPNNPANPVTLPEAIADEPRLQEARDTEPEVADLLDKSQRLEGLYRHASTHAAGVVIGDRPLDELVPLYLDPRGDMPATQFNMKWVEPAGLVKFDFLGLKTLTVLQRAIEFIRQTGVELDLSHVPLNDKPTFKMLGEGASVGVFQLESAGMRQTLKAMKPDSLEDIIALVSLYRPGPMDNIPTYIERKAGNQEPDYLHPLLEPVLKETYGVIIYQEQVMQIAQILSGYSLGEADLLRRAMGKKKKEEMDKQKIRFIDGARANNVDEKKADGIFELVAKFAGYGFNKSHAAAYAFIAYQTAFLKANHPAEFLAASMSLDRGNTDKLAIFMEEARRLKLEVRPPDVNDSEADFSVRGGVIHYALAAVKNVGFDAMSGLVASRAEGGPFASLTDFANRVDPQNLNKRAVENLARAGAFDRFKVTRAAAFKGAGDISACASRAQAARESSQTLLFADASGVARERLDLPELDEWPALEKLDNEQGAIGFYFSGHPLDDYADALSKLNIVSAQELCASAEVNRKTGVLAGVVRSVRFRKSKSGKPFAWVGLSDRQSDFEVTVFSEVLTAARDDLETGRLLRVTASAENRDGEVRLTAEGIDPLDSAVSNAHASMRVIISDAEALVAIKRRLEAVNPDGPRARKGPISIIMHTSDARREIEVKLPGLYALSPALSGALKSAPGVDAIEFG